MKTINLILPNGFNVLAIDGSETVIDEIWKNKFYEKKYSIKSGVTVVDIGANQGFFSLYAAARGARVIAYEPEKTNFDILTENIKRNNLMDIIQINNCAIGKNDGEIEIYMKGYETPFASNMVSTSKEFIKKAFFNKKLIDEIIIRQTVSCLTLNTVLKYIKESIDLLKIDCEGAELDIMSSITENDMIKVNNIVMETHDIYPFSQLFYRIQEIGFTIRYFEKPHGIFKTGYIFAVNKKQNNKSIENNGPIAILKCPKIIIKNEIANLDASQSFPYEKNNKIKYIWSINESVQEHLKPEEVKISFNSCGPQNICLEVKDDNGKTDIEQQKIWVFDNKYYQHSKILELPEKGKTERYLIKGKASFKLSKEKFPDFWMPDRVIIGLKLIKYTQSPLKYCFNDEETFINQIYSEKEFNSFPPEMDLIISLISEEEKIVEFKWWWIKKADIEITDKDENSVCNLGSISSELHCEIIKDKKFRVLKTAYPNDWSPRCLKFGIAAIPTNGINTQLDGYIIVNNTRHALIDWYTEIGFTEFNSDSDFEFTVEFSEARNIKIVWWAE